MKHAVRPGTLLDAADLPETPETARLLALLRRSERVHVGNLWGSAQALLLAWCAARAPLSDAPLLVLAADDGEAEALRGDLAAFGLEAAWFPARDGSVEGDAVRVRLDLAQRCLAGAEDRPRVLVAGMQALLQPLPAATDLQKEFLELRLGMVLDAEKLLRHLVALGYDRQPLAEAPGEVSLRGDILDVFPFASQLPLRVELFEDEIEGLRTFDPTDQRSVERHERVSLCLASDTAEVGEAGALQPAELLGPDAWFVSVEPLRVEERAETLRIRSSAHERALQAFHKLRSSRRQLLLQSLPGEDISLETRSVQALQVGVRQAAAALREAAADGARVLVPCVGEADEQVLHEALEKGGGAPGTELVQGLVTRGFRVPAWKLVVVNHHELKGVLGSRRRQAARPQHKVRAIQSFFELKRGDLVVHAVHGLGRFQGLTRMKRGAGEEEHLHLLFADDVSLYVPGSRVDLVQRYIGGGGPHLPLDKVGGSAFRKRKEKVQRGLFDLAAELIEVQARRALRKRDPWTGDAELVQAMVEAFPYEDTVDQASATVEIQRDLLADTPMDRMVCGDVGFGKTELAVRAAFRVVSGGAQVAVLVPTTVLAQQHYETFRERLADFPVTVDLLNRYVTGKDAKDVVTRTAAGEVDVLVGTHRILSKDVRFHRLGLVVIDEEQRFGVTHKEHFKKLRAEVDLLTLTATPIPRTLHMSLSGIRDISALSVPPPGRHAIETRLGYNDDEELVREAILRERARGGQVFFLHNRVASIEACAARLQHLVPGITCAVGHGQMGAGELRAVMEAFTRGEADVLVATTIIENGVDIPAAGTILIEDADHFGLGELHQLRGRVGRGSQHAHCYLLVERHKPLRDIARQRLKALEEMSHLGAGFGISIKDLELRGAGNVLGAEQSGHIAAVGYDMYCRLLKATVDRLQSGEGPDAAPRVQDTEGGVELELGLRAFLPPEWVPDPDTRLELLRELSEVHTEEEAAAASESLRDRFGRPPAEAEELLRLFVLRARLEPHGIRRVLFRDDLYVVEYDDRLGFERLFGAVPTEVRRLRAGLAHLLLPRDARTPHGAALWLEALLHRA